MKDISEQINERIKSIPEFQSLLNDNIEVKGYDKIEPGEYSISSLIGYLSNDKIRKMTALQVYIYQFCFLMILVVTIIMVYTGETSQVIYVINGVAMIVSLGLAYLSYIKPPKYIVASMIDNSIKETKMLLKSNKISKV